MEADVPADGAGDFFAGAVALVFCVFPEPVDWAKAGLRHSASASHIRAHRAKVAGFLFKEIFFAKIFLFITKLSWASYSLAGMMPAGGLRVKRQSSFGLTYIDP